jgi:hypothetical protein
MRGERLYDQLEQSYVVYAGVYCLRTGILAQEGAYTLCTCRMDGSSRWMPTIRTPTLQLYSVCASGWAATGNARW